MRMYDLIQKKRNGEELTDAEIRYFIKGYTANEIPDYQVSALMMAIYFRGMTDRETVTLTDAMANSGDTVDLSRFGELSVDKHSTGGVGDKTSLIITPIVASLGAKVTKMSGRGLGHTGGTVDKLESIPGYRTTLSSEEFLEQVEKIGIAVIGQTGNLTPADKKLYALRDVTATVDSIPLITSSIMSKKIAAGSHSIVLDVKVGSGAFMKTPEDAEVLAKNMVRIGKKCGRNIAALLTDMDSPLGSAVGNAVEIKEAVSVLKGESSGNLKTVCVALASAMLSLVFGYSHQEAEDKVNEAINSGAAFAKMKEWIAAQGGDTAYLDDVSLFPQAKFEYKVLSDRSGYITAMDAETIGNSSVILGAGRLSKDDDIDHSAGIIIEKNIGDYVEKGEPVCTLLTNKEEALSEAASHYLTALTFGEEKLPEKPLIYNIIR